MIIKTIVTFLIFSLIFLISCSSSGTNDSSVGNSDGGFLISTPTPFSTVDCEPYGGFTLLEGKMFNERQRHGWVILSDSQILTTGGRGKGGPRGPRVFPHSETFNLDTGQWTESGDMLSERQDFAMFTLDDGRVLVAGGQDIQMEAMKNSEV